MSIARCIAWFKNANKIWSKSTSHDNCLVCALGPSILLGSLLGLFTLDGHCKQNDENALKASYKTSKIKIVTGICTSIVFLTIVAGYWYIFYENKVNNLLKLQIVAEGIISLQTASIVFSMILKTHCCQLLLNGWNDVFNKPEHFGVRILLTKKDVMLLRKRANILSVITILVTFSFCVLLYRSITEIDTTTYIFRTFSAVVCLYTQLVIVFQFGTYGAFVGYTFRRYEQLLMTHLNIRIPTFQFPGIKVDYRELNISQNNLKMQLRAFIRLYEAMVLNVKYFNLFVNPIMLIWFSSVLCILIINVYLLIKQFAYGMNNGNDIATLEGETVCIIGGMIYLINSFQGGNIVVNDILSTLYRYPISKLSWEETAQVETLITTLTSKRPVLNAAGIFTIGTRLLASVSGTVITYVLVALQFRPSWQGSSNSSF